MGRYLGRRLLELIPVFFGVLLVVFIITRLTPGDPAVVMLGEKATPEAVARPREVLGLNDTLPVQLTRLPRRVLVELIARFPATIEPTPPALLEDPLKGVFPPVPKVSRPNPSFDGVSMI